MWRRLPAVSLLLPLCVLAAGHHRRCGGTFTDLRGVLHTPNFPEAFPVPIRCEWVIDSQNLNPSPNSSIVVYLTQLFVFEGLRFTEYPVYDRRYSNLKGNEIHTVSEANVSKVGWVMTHESYLVINLELDSIESTHLRVLDHFLDVYGFNITYEITNGRAREDACTMMDCGFTGVCYDHYTKFSCDCFPGYSGPSCSGGPRSPCTLAADQPACKNGATCLNVGTEAFMCSCPPGFSGKSCEVPRNASGTNKDCDNCSVSCPFDGSQENTCRCPKSQNSTRDLAVFSAEMHLGNLPNVSDDALHRFVEKQVQQTMNANYSRATENVALFRIRRSRSGADVILHFHGPRKDEKKVRSILTRWAQRGYIGNLTVAQKDVNFVTAELQSVSVNRRGLIRAGEEFILSCEAKGPRNIAFRWFKDGLFVNVNLSKSGNKWRKLVHNVSDQYIDILEVDKAGYLDEGAFTCQVEVNGIQYCRTVNVGVRKPPLVKIEPMSLAVAKHQNFSIKCISMSENVENRYTYIWRKNGKLLPIKTPMEKYEILYPGGSILQVSSIEKSATYSCLVQDRDLSTELNATVDVLDARLVSPCPAVRHLGVAWPAAAPGTAALAECPAGYAGAARRRCAPLERGRAAWGAADFSGCQHRRVREEVVKFQKLTLGYEQTDVERTLRGYVEYASGGALLPGEGAALLALALDVVGFVGGPKDAPASTPSLVCGVVNNVLRQSGSLVDEGQVILLQRVVQATASLVKPQETFRCSLEDVDVTVAPGPVKVPIEGGIYPSWFNFQLLDKPSKPMQNSTSPVAVVVYRNLSSFLPARSAIRLNDGTEIDYEILSSVAAVWPQRGASAITVAFDHPPPGRSPLEWTVSCAVADFAAFSYGWEPRLCGTGVLNATRTRCSCSRGGTLAVLLAKRPESAETPEDNSHQLIIVVGCTLCLSLSLATATVLTFYWMIRKSCLVFLKIQCCLSVAGAMIVFVVAVSYEPNEISYVYIVTFLETFLLVGMSSQLSKLLIVYTEIVQLPRPGNRKQTVIGIITGVPVIAVFGNHLAYRTMNRRLESWWLLRGSLAFSIFMACASAILVLFVFLYFTVTSKLKKLMVVHEKCSRALQKRIDALKRSACVFLAIVVLVASSVVYINSSESLFWLYEFSGSAVVLGFTLLLCYVLKSETSMRHHFTKRLKQHEKEDSCFSSDSVNSPLNFFTKQDPDVESESVPQRKQTLEEAPALEASFVEKERTLERYTNSPKHYAKTLNEPSVFPQSPDILAPKVCVELDLVASSIKTAQSEIKNAEELEIKHVKLYPPPKICVVTPDEAIEKLIEDPSMRNDAERLQPEGREGATAERAEDNLDGMLDSISHDLDYLLNRTPEIETTALPSSSSFRRISKPPAINIIVEESEDEATKLPEAITDVLRTSC